MADISLTEDFKNNAGAVYLQAQEDYAHEMNGGSHSRISRFFVAAGGDDQQTRAEKRHDDLMTSLQIMIASNAAYAKLYKDFGELLDNATSRLVHPQFMFQN